MNRIFLIDYLSYILFRALGSLIRILPVGFSLFLGRRLGDCLYFFDRRHKAIVYVNLKTALLGKFHPKQLMILCRKFYRAFGQNIIEVFFTPLVDKEYLKKYITIDGLDNIRQAFKRGKGIILVTVHNGSWELSNIVAANLGLPFSLLVREQPKFNRLNKLLNFYRAQKGCKLIFRKNQTKEIIRVLQNNEAIGMTVDQGGRNGTLIKFFGKTASMSTGAIRLALKYDAAILPVFFNRIKGPYIRISVGEQFEIEKTGDTEKDTYQNLQRLFYIFEDGIKKFPHEYLWTYRIWKYAKEKNILILSDGKAGHLRQAQALSKLIADYLLQKGISSYTASVDIKFKNVLLRYALALNSCPCRLTAFLKKESYDLLLKIKPDIIISCGSSLAPVNYLLSKENLSKSIALMRPPVLSLKKFDLVIMPKHDNPPRRKNVVVTEGALNLMDEEFLKEQSQRLLTAAGCKLQNADNIGLLIGGDSKSFSLGKDTISEVIKQIKSVSEKFNAGILITTSRRTSKQIEALVKEEFKNYPRCKLLVIANEKNYPEAVGGILGLSKIIISSAESISMISEAASSARYVLAFGSKGLSKKHRRFLKHFAQRRYIYLEDAQGLEKRIEDILTNKPKSNTLNDNLLVKEALSRIL